MMLLTKAKQFWPLGLLAAFLAVVALWRLEVAQHEATTIELSAAQAANLELAKWGTEQVERMERIGSLLAEHQRQRLLDQETIDDLREAITNVPTVPCFDDPMPGSVTDSVRRAATETTPARTD